jgi:hypothetical protein
VHESLVLKCGSTEDWRVGSAYKQTCAVLTSLLQCPDVIFIAYPSEHLAQAVIDTIGKCYPSHALGPIWLSYPRGFGHSQQCREIAFHHEKERLDTRSRALHPGNQAGCGFWNLSSTGPSRSPISNRVSNWKVAFSARDSRRVEACQDMRLEHKVVSA